MKIQAISKQQYSNKTFKAMPDKEALEILQNAYQKTLEQGSETEIQAAIIALRKIKEVGRHYNGFKNPLMLTIEFQKDDCYIKAVSEKHLPLKVKVNSKILPNLALELNHSMLGRIARFRDAKYNAKEMMNSVFGTSV